MEDHPKDKFKACDIATDWRDGTHLETLFMKFSTGESIDIDLQPSGDGHGCKPVILIYKLDENGDPQKFMIAFDKDGKSTISYDF
jgi:hypothetical protein